MKRARTASLDDEIERAIAERLYLKGVDNDIALSTLPNSTVTNTGSQVINLIAPGAGSFNRIGRKVTLKSLHLKGDFIHTNSNAANAYEGVYARLLLIWDKIPNGTVPDLDEIIGKTDQTGSTGGSSIMDDIRYGAMDRFELLWDRIMDMPMYAGGDQGTNKIPTTNRYTFDEWIDLDDLTTNYSGQSSPCALTDIGQGALYLYGRASDANVVQVSTFSTFRLRYLD